MPACAAAPRKRGLDAEVASARRRSPRRSARRGRTRSRTSLRSTRGVERLRAGERDLLADREQQLEVDRRALAADAGARAPAAPRPRPCCRRRGSPSLAFSQTPSASTGSTGACSGHRVEVRAQQHASRRARSPPARAGSAREQVAAVEPIARAGAVLLDLEPERAQLGDHALARSARSLPGRALDRGTARRRWRSGSAARARRRRRAGAASLTAAADARRRAGDAPRSAGRCDASSRAARAPARRAMNSRNSGAGRSGRDLNSGWNWEATKNGCSLELDRPRPGARRARCPTSRRPGRLCRRLRSRLLTS